MTKPDFIESDIKIPKTYVLCTKDEVVAPAYQESFIKTGDFDNVIKIDSGHFPFISAPEKVVEAILGAIKE